MDLRAHSGQGVGGHILDVPTQEVAPVFADVENRSVGLLAHRNFNRDLVEARRRGIAQDADLDAEGWAPGIELAQEGFQLLLDGRSRRERRTWRPQGTNFWAIGKGRPTLKALDVIFSPGGACLRLYSLWSTRSATSRTSSR